MDIVFWFQKSWFFEIFYGSIYSKYAGVDMQNLNLMVVNWYKYMDV